MRALVQRVLSSSVEVDGKIVGKIAKGWLILLGIRDTDTSEQANYLAEKCVHLRAFSDAQGKMNLSVLDVGGSILVVSQFTLYGDCSRGRRPDFFRAAPPQRANELYEEFCKRVREFGVHVEQGIFQADMKVSLINDGPVTLLVEKEAEPNPVDTQFGPD